MKSLKILALEPYYGGSHQSFLEGWRKHSQHRWTLFDLPARWWKWRMRHASITLARQFQRWQATGATCDVLLCSDMLNLPELLGLAPTLASRPSVLYFHENQWTYPVQVPQPRDEHFGFTNFISALAATRVWFNSDFHRREMLSGCAQFLQRMPDHPMPDELEAIGAKATVHYPGIEFVDAEAYRRDGPLHIVWAARWEHDKGPQTLLAALCLLDAAGIEFQLSVMGETYRQKPACFAEIRARFGNSLRGWGFQSRQQYLETLQRGHVFVSTAEHEFFGISAVEAVQAGLFPLLPNRLAYPEVFDLARHPERTICFYDGSAQELANRLQQLATCVRDDVPFPLTLAELQASVQSYAWPVRATAMDRALVELVEFLAETQH